MSFLPSPFNWHPECQISDFRTLSCPFANKGEIKSIWDPCKPNGTGLGLPTPLFPWKLQSEDKWGYCVRSFCCVGLEVSLVGVQTICSHNCNCRKQREMQANTVSRVTPPMPRFPQQLCGPCGWVTAGLGCWIAAGLSVRWRCTVSCVSWGLGQPEAVITLSCNTSIPTTRMCVCTCGSICVFVCVHIHDLCVHVCGCKCTCVHMHVEARGWCQVRHWIWSWLTQLG